MKKTFLFLLLLGQTTSFAQKQSPVQSFPLQDVRLLESPFKQAEQTDLRYILSLDVDRLLYPFLREAGIPTTAKSYGNWENTGLDGHVGGHYLTALSLMYASTGDKRIEERLNYMVAQLKKCQDKNGNGYLAGIPNGAAMWTDVAKGSLKVDAFSVNNRWVPWYNIHKTFAGLRDAYLYAHNQDAKTMLIKLSDWTIKLVENLSEEQIQTMLNAEHGGMNEVFADVAAITGDKKYLTLAQQFSHQRILTPLATGKDALTGIHANTQIPKIIGFQRISELNKNENYHKAARFFWERVVNNRSVAIGGNSVREHFHPDTDFSSMITDVEGPETCNTYNMLKLSKLLFQQSGDVRYINYYEKGLYNHILSSQHPEKGGFVYFTPMRPRHYRVYSSPQESFWCCVGSGLENHAKYGELIYAHTDKDVWVNLFIPSVLTWKEKQLSLRQTTRFPDQENTSLRLTLKKPTHFSLKLRYPSWVAEKQLSVRINGKKQENLSVIDGYVVLDRTWKNNDEVSIQLPMHNSLEEMPAHLGFEAVFHGPILLAAKTDTSDLKGLVADDSRMGHVAQGKQYPLFQAPMLVGNDNSVLQSLQPVAGKSLTFSASSSLYPASYKNLELIPFFRLHDARYTIYFKKALKDSIEVAQNALASLDYTNNKDEARTVDKVFPGEQQPESDHFFEGNQTQAGVHRNRHWRDATGWFSYVMNNKDKKAHSLQVTYYGLDKNRSFDILINNQVVSSVTLTGNQGDNFFAVEYPIPAETLQNSTDNKLVVKFVAKSNSVAGGIYEVRLLRKK